MTNWKTMMMRLVTLMTSPFHEWWACPIKYQKSTFKLKYTQVTINTGKMSLTASWIS